jgi:hypothetical protein
MKHRRRGLFYRCVTDWMAAPNIIENGIADGQVSRQPKPGWVALKGVSPISDLFGPEAYASPGCAAVYNRWVRRLRRRIALFAFIHRISKRQAEARIETDAQFTKALVGMAHAEGKPV